jgi:hypothetical protein
MTTLLGHRFTEMMKRATLSDMPICPIEDLKLLFEYLWVPEPHRTVAPPVTNILGAQSLCLLFGDERYRAAAVQHEFDCGWHVGVDDPRVGDSRPMHETTPVWPMYEGAVAEDTGENDPGNYSDHPDYVTSWDQSNLASGLEQPAAYDPAEAWASDEEYDSCDVDQLAAHEKQLQESKRVTRSSCRFVKEAAPSESAAKSSPVVEVQDWSIPTPAARDESASSGAIERSPVVATGTGGFHSTDSLLGRT